MPQCDGGRWIQNLSQTVADDNMSIVLLKRKESRVEERRGGLGRSLFSPVARPFGHGCPIISAVLRFHSPLIEPYVHFSCIRLSDSTFTVGHSEGWGRSRRSWQSPSFRYRNSSRYREGVARHP